MLTRCTGCGAIHRLGRDLRDAPATWYLEQVPESYRSEIVWQTLADTYLNSFDPDLHDKKKALYAAEKAVYDCHDSNTFALAAEAAYENGQYAAAARYQKDALWEGAPDEHERIARLELYRALASTSQD